MGDQCYGCTEVCDSFLFGAGVDEGFILSGGFLKDVTFRERVLAYVSHLLLPSPVVAGFLLPYL